MQSTTRLEYEVVVVSVGFTGLTAPLDLTRTSKSVLVLEGDAVLGGLASTLEFRNGEALRFLRPVAEPVSDASQQLLATGDPNHFRETAVRCNAQAPPVAFSTMHRTLKIGIYRHGGMVRVRFRPLA